MKLSCLFFVFALLSSTPIKCQRRGSLKGMRPGARRSIFMEERARNMLAPQPTPNYYNPPNIVAPVCQTPVESYAKIEAPVLQSMPAPPVPNLQTMIIPPNLQILSLPQNFQNLANMPVLQGTNVPNLQQYVQNLQFVPNMPTLQEMPVPKEPLLEVPIQAPEVVRVPMVPEESCSCMSPTPLSNAFLPAASPISPWAPPNFLPPINTCPNRNHYLRKIPIPPPTL